MPICNSESTSATTDTNTCSQIEMRQQLEKMFPMSRPEAITNAIEKSVNVHEAVDILLGSTVEETDSDESLPAFTFIQQSRTPSSTRTNASGSEHVNSVDDDEITVLENYIH